MVEHLSFHETKKGSYGVPRWRTFLSSVEILFFLECRFIWFSLIFVAFYFFRKIHLYSPSGKVQKMNFLKTSFFWFNRLHIQALISHQQWETIFWSLKQNFDHIYFLTLSWGGVQVNFPKKNKFCKTFGIHRVLLSFQRWFRISY